MVFAKKQTVQVKGFLLGCKKKYLREKLVLKRKNKELVKTEVNNSQAQFICQIALMNVLYRSY